MISEAYPLVSDDPAIQSAYVRLREAGESHNIAEICAFRQPTGTRGTEKAFLQGHCNGNQFADDPEYGDMCRSRAAAAGVDITGKVYLHGLAREEADPEAWVSDTGDLKKKVIERHGSCEGAVNVKAPQYLPAKDEPPPKLSETAISGEMERRIEENPDLARSDPTELREQILDECSPLH